MKQLFLNKNKILLVCSLMASLSACKKYLNESSDKRLAIVSSLDDLQALLDRPDKTFTGYSGAGEESSDDYYLSQQDFNALTEDYDRRRYLWEALDIFPPGENSNDWGRIYGGVYAATAILELLPGVPGNSSEEGRHVKGQALMWRAFRYMDAAQTWTLPYDAGTATTDAGLPLRLQADMNVPSVRSTVAETYDQILKDLKESVPMLPVNPISRVRASRQAAYGLLARAYLNMRKYDQAALYADSCIRLYNRLIDFNTLKSSDPFPIKYLNDEVILQAYTSGTLVHNTIAKINPQLYQMYHADDLRLSICFSKNTDGSYQFKGGFMGGLSIFKGLATGEMYLIRAEGYARAGKTDLAIQDLNTLLAKRWNNTKTWLPYTAANANDALQLVLSERRKELVMRGIRWQDIRRLNKENANITLTRTIDGKTYQLLPNDLRYALAIPQDIIERSSMPQNKR